MTRQYNILDLISLPRLNSLTAIALAEQMLTASAGIDTLPTLISRPRARLQTATDGLKTQFQPKQQADALANREADQALDAAWRILRQWLGALAALPEGAISNEAQVQTVNNLLFSNGLSFTTLSYREQWTASEAKLNALTETTPSGETGEAIIEQAGGSAFLATLKSAHQTYGDVLGITQAVKEEENPKLREHLLNVIAAIKVYAFKVLAFADPEEMGSQILCQTLLLPLTGWEDKAVRPEPEINDSSKFVA